MHNYSGVLRFNPCLSVHMNHLCSLLEFSYFSLCYYLAWDSEGCQTIRSDDGSVECRCSHLSSFATVEVVTIHLLKISGTFVVMPIEFTLYSHTIVIL